MAGVTTFGKGLVQRQYMLNDGSALLLTVARYYTPSGRLIQRSYADREEYLEHWRNSRDDLQAAKEDTAGKPVYHTLNEQRVVYGGGGITPDVFIDTRYDLTDAEISLEQSRLPWEFANEFAAKHDLKGSMSLDDFLHGWTLPEDALRELDARALADTSLHLTAEDLSAEADYVRKAVKRELAGNLWGQNARYRVIIKDDPVLAEALTHFPEAERMAKLYAESPEVRR